MSESRDFGWFRAVDAPFGPTWWSSRHGCFVRLFRGLDATNPPPFGLGVPGPRELAWSTTRDWVACEHVFGPTLAELLLRVPHQALRGDLVRSIVGRALACSVRFTHDGWAFPETKDIRLGFDRSRAPRRGVRGPPRREVGMSRHHGILRLPHRRMHDDDPHAERRCRTRLSRAA
jgi:hypothetical protein